MPTTPRTRAFVKIAIALLPVLIIAVTALAIDPENGGGEGRWVASSEQDCSDGLVCTEWELTYGTSQDPACCQDGSILGSSIYSACLPGQESHFRH